MADQIQPAAEPLLTPPHQTNVLDFLCPAGGAAEFDRTPGMFGPKPHYSANRSTK